MHFAVNDKVRFTQERLAVLSPLDKWRVAGRVGVVQGAFNSTRKPIVYFPAVHDLRLFGFDPRHMELVTDEVSVASQTEADDLFA